MNNTMLIYRKAYIKTILVIMMLACAAITVLIINQFAAKAYDKTEINPVPGDKLTITFIDEGYNTLRTEQLALGQVIRVMDNNGRQIKEYAVRQAANIKLPEMKKEGGYVFKEWVCYYLYKDFYLEPSYYIEVEIYDSWGREITKETVDPGFIVEEYAFNESEPVVEKTIEMPDIWQFSSPREIDGYKFVNWTYYLDENVLFKAVPVYELLPPPPPAEEETEVEEETFYFDTNKIILIAAGVIIIGLLAFIMIRSKKGK